MKSLIWIFISIGSIGICSVLFLFGYPFFGSYYANNKILDRYITRMEQIEHPSKTFSISATSGVHRPPGNGTNCYYFVAEVREFEGNREDILAFYRAQKIPVVMLENEEFSREVPYGFHQLETWDLDLHKFGRNLYLIYSLNADFDNYRKNSFDFRCH